MWDLARMRNHRIICRAGGINIALLEGLAPIRTMESQAASWFITGES